MILKERSRVIWGSIFLLLALVLVVYFFMLASNWNTIKEATTILALLTAVVALILSLFNNVKLRKSWKK